MLRKALIVLAATASVALLAPGMAQARGFGGGHGFGERGDATQGRRNNGAGRPARLSRNGGGGAIAMRLTNSLIGTARSRDCRSAKPSW